MVAVGRPMWFQDGTTERENTGFEAEKGVGWDLTAIKLLPGHSLWTAGLNSWLRESSGSSQLGGTPYRGPADHDSA